MDDDISRELVFVHESPHQPRHKAKRRKKASPLPNSFHFTMEGQLPKQSDHPSGVEQQYLNLADETNSLMNNVNNMIDFSSPSPPVSLLQQHDEVIRNNEEQSSNLLVANSSLLLSNEFQHTNHQAENSSSLVEQVNQDLVRRRHQQFATLFLPSIHRLLEEPLEKRQQQDGEDSASGGED